MRELQKLKEKEKAAPAAPEVKYVDAVPPFSTPLQIVKYPAPCLRAENVGLKAFGDDLALLAKEMFSVMYATDGIGLAAPQVGVNVRMMVFNAEGVPGRGEEVVLVNPQIVQFGEKLDWYEEGCLSFPKLYADVKRPLTCTVKAQDMGGEDIELRLDGLEARVFQHEYDHLDGVLYIDRMTPTNKSSIQGGLNLLLDAYGADDAAP